MAPNPEDVRNLIDRHVAAWCAKSPEGVARSYTGDAVFSINRGEPMKGHADIAEMVRGFCAAFPDLELILDHAFVAGDHAAYVWTFRGTHGETGRRVSFQGWEEWELTPEPRVRASLGWYDEQDYARQLGEVPAALEEGEGS